MSSDKAGSGNGRGQSGAEGRLLALFDGRPDGATAVGAALRLHGAERIAIEAETVDERLAVRATWPLASHGLMTEAWLRDVVHHIRPCGRDRVRANLGAARRVAIFVSKTEHCLADLLQRQWSGGLRCEIAFVASNREECRTLADLYGIPFHYFDADGQSREQVEAGQLALLESERVNLVVLARYMKVLSAEFVNRYPGRIINIHHALLPAFVGKDTYARAISRGVKYIGATAHYATEVLDAGPIIEQEVMRVTHRDDKNSLMQKGAELERLTLARAVQMHVDDRVLVVNERVVVFEGHATQHNALLEGLMLPGSDDTIAATPAAQHWIDSEWPALELRRSVPDALPVVARYAKREAA